LRNKIARIVRSSVSNTIKAVTILVSVDPRRQRDRNGFGVTYFGKKQKVVCPLTDVGVCVVPALRIILVYVQLGGLQQRKTNFRSQTTHKFQLSHTIIPQHFTEPEAQLPFSKKTKSEVLSNISLTKLFAPSAVSLKPNLGLEDHHLSAVRNYYPCLETVCSIRKPSACHSRIMDPLNLPTDTVFFIISFKPTSPTEVTRDAAFQEIPVTSSPPPPRETQQQRVHI
jgi:hypothetical protein